MIKILGLSSTDSSASGASDMLFLVSFLIFLFFFSYFLFNCPYTFLPTFGLMISFDFILIVMFKEKIPRQLFNKSWYSRLSAMVSFLIFLYIYFFFLCESFFPIHGFYHDLYQLHGPTLVGPESIFL